MRDWIAFWNSSHSIYVNARHRDVHYRAIADDVRAYVPHQAATVLDYGCGEALHADRVANGAGRLILSDAAPAVRETLKARFAGNSKIEVETPEHVHAMAAGSLDLIVMNSVAQYLTTEEFDCLLGLFHRLLRPGGRLLLGDVLPPSLSPLTDAAALLRFAASEGFLLAAAAGLVRTAFSDYRRLRTAIGLATYNEAAILGRLTAAGFSANRLPKNIGHNHARMSFLAVRPAGSA